MSDTIFNNRKILLIVPFVSAIVLQLLTIFRNSSVVSDRKFERCDPKGISTAEFSSSRGVLRFPMKFSKNPAR